MLNGTDLHRSLDKAHSGGPKGSLHRTDTGAETAGDLCKSQEDFRKVYDRIPRQLCWKVKKVWMWGYHVVDNYGIICKHETSTEQNSDRHQHLHVTGSSYQCSLIHVVH